jgi:hypothetical protein
MMAKFIVCASYYNYVEIEPEDLMREVGIKSALVSLLTNSAVPAVEIIPCDDAAEEMLFLEEEEVVDMDLSDLVKEFEESSDE